MKISSASLTGLDKKRLAIWLTVFFLVLVSLAGILVQYSYRQMKWETFNQYRLLSRELTNRVDDRFSRLIKTEESRSFVDYSFLNVAGDPSAGFVQRSVLAEFPMKTAIPGLVGYFQVDAEGVYSTPLLPDPTGQEISYGITQSELQQRAQVRQLQASEPAKQEYRNSISKYLAGRGVFLSDELLDGLTEEGIALLVVRVQVADDHHLGHVVVDQRALRVLSFAMG